MFTRKTYIAKAAMLGVLLSVVSCEKKRNINFADPAASGKSYAFVCRNNDFIGSSDGGDDAVGIVFTGAMTEDEIAGIIRTNYFAHCGSSPVTVDEMNAGIIRNYYGDDATGGTLVDPGT